MKINDYGNQIISSSLKRLKRLKSLEDDLNVYFKAHKNELQENGLLSCKIADGEGKNLRYWVCKERIIITNPKTGSKDGCRLWFILIFLDPNTVFYVRTVLYSVKEEKAYPKSKCYEIVKETIEKIL